MIASAVFGFTAATLALPVVASICIPMFGGPFLPNSVVSFFLPFTDALYLLALLSYILALISVILGGLATGQAKRQGRCFRGASFAGFVLGSCLAGVYSMALLCGIVFTIMYSNAYM
jgi:hypothetical protein